MCVTTNSRYHPTAATDRPPPTPAPRTPHVVVRQLHPPHNPTHLGGVTLTSLLAEAQHNMAAAVALPRLPPPGGSQQEVLFRRMLLQCSARAPAGAPSQKDDGTTPDWRTDPKFHCVSDCSQTARRDYQAFVCLNGDGTQVTVCAQCCTC